MRPFSVCSQCPQKYAWTFIHNAPLLMPQDQTDCICENKVYPLGMFVHRVLCLYELKIMHNAPLLADIEYFT